MFPRKIHHTLKPHQRGSINKSNSISRGMLRLWQNDSLIDLDGHTLINDHSTVADIVLTPSIKGKVFDYGYNGSKTIAEAVDTPISGSQNRTFAAWIYNTNTSTSTYIFHINDGSTGSNGTRWSIASDSSNLRIEIQGQGYTSSLGTAAGWHFIAMILDGTTTADHLLYVDGVSEQASGANTVNTTSTNTIRLGGRDNGSTTVKCIEKIAIGGLWSRALSIKELDSLYANFNQLLSPRTQLLPLTVGVAPPTTIPVFMNHYRNQGIA